MSPEKLARYIDHTLLKPNINKEQIDTLCDEALKYNFASVCIPPYYVRRAFDKLQESESVKVCTVIGFPLGYDTTSSKVEAIKNAIDHGADELDVVINIAAIKDADWKYVEYELDTLSSVVKRNNKVIKIIFETCYLTNQEIEDLAKACVKFEIDLF